MARMVAIGAERFMLPFGVLGFEMVEADSITFAKKLRDALTDGVVALVVIPESLVPQDSAEEFRELVAASEQVVLIVPDGPKPKGVGYEMVRSAIGHAAGVDLLSSIEVDGGGRDV